MVLQPLVFIGLVCKMDRIPSRIKLGPPVSEMPGMQPVFLRFFLSAAVLFREPFDPSFTNRAWKGCFMRLDKYLKVSRIIKRRTVANEACDAGRVLVNGKPARASYDVKQGDVMELQLGSRCIRAQVVSVNEYARKENAEEMYKILSDEPKTL